MKKTAVLSISAIALVFSLLLAGCFSLWRGDETTGTITITIGDGSGRAVLPWDEATQIEDLLHTIRLFNGPSPEQIQEGVKANLPVHFTVQPGRWDISVKAIHNGVVKAEALMEGVLIKAGKNSPIPISMKQPEGGGPVEGFTPVTGIINGPTGKVVAVPLPLTGIVTPQNATNQTIVWSLVSAGETGASISDGILTTEAAGTAIVRATIINGKAIGTDYTQDFEIKVVTTVVPVTNITGVPTSAYTGVPLALMTDNIVITPSDATYQSIEWSILNDGGTGSTISGATLTAASAGTVTVRATITNGKGVGENYTQEFEITVAKSPLTGTVTITLRAGVEFLVNAPLLAKYDGEMAGDPTWQWKRGNETISGVTSDTYTITAADLGKTLTATVEYSGNDGTKSGSQYVDVDAKTGIYNAAQLADIGTNAASLSKDYILIADDINLEDYSNWAPIGDNSTEDDNSRFTGTFDGGNKTIDGLSINDPGKYNGLFGFITGTVRNLNVVGTVIGGNWAGGIAGGNDGGTVNNCNFTGSVSGVGYVGGIVGENIGTVEDCTSDADVTGNRLVGGVVGSNGASGEVLGCSAAGSITGTEDTGLAPQWIGGVAGENSGTVTNCHYEPSNDNSVTADDGSSIGGVVGSNNSGAVGVKYCSLRGDITAPAVVNGSGSVGGVVGSNHASIENCYAIGIISGTTNVGGVAGDNLDADIQYCYAIGEVQCRGDYGGGVVGFNDVSSGPSIIRNCYAAVDVADISNTGAGYFGGVVGRNYGLVDYCYATGSVGGTYSYSVGGVAGENSGMVQHCVALNGGIDGASYLGRVAGNDTDIASSYANSNMSVRGSTLDPDYDDIRPESPHGADVGNSNSSPDALRYDRREFWTYTVLWDDSVWTITDGRLPGFGAAVALPEHLLQ